MSQEIGVPDNYEMMVPLILGHHKTKQGIGKEKETKYLKWIPWWRFARIQRALYWRRSFRKTVPMTKRYCQRETACRADDEIVKILEKKLPIHKSRAEFAAEAIRYKLIQVRK